MHRLRARGSVAGSMPPAGESVGTTAGVNTGQGGSRHLGSARQEALVELSVVVEDSAPQFLLGPRQRRTIRIVDVTTAERLVAIP